VGLHQAISIGARSARDRREKKSHIVENHLTVKIVVA
jgi:hypothetical protein